MGWVGWGAGARERAVTYVGGMGSAWERVGVGGMGVMGVESVLGAWCALVGDGEQMMESRVTECECGEGSSGKGAVGGGRKAWMRAKEAWMRAKGGFEDDVNNGATCGAEGACLDLCRYVWLEALWERTTCGTMRVGVLKGLFMERAVELLACVLVWKVLVLLPWCHVVWNGEHVE